MSNWELFTYSQAHPSEKGRPHGLIWRRNGRQHVVFRGADDHIHQQVYKDGRWVHDDLTSMIRARIGHLPDAASDPQAYTWWGDRGLHIVFRGTDDNIHEIRQTERLEAWDLSTAAGAPPAKGTPWGYAWAGDGDQHVMYRGADDQLHELHYTRGRWRHYAHRGPACLSDPCVYTWPGDGAQHVVHLGPGGRVVERYYLYDWHVMEDLSAAAGAPRAAGGPMGFSSGADGRQHVVYRDVGGGLRELYYPGDHGGWSHIDLGHQAGVSPAGDPWGYARDPAGTQCVVFSCSEGHVHHLSYKGRWHHVRLTRRGYLAEPGGAVIGYPVEPGLSEHILWRTAEGRLVEAYERRWQANRAEGMLDLQPLEHSGEHVYVLISGFLSEGDDHRAAWKGLDHFCNPSSKYALQWPAGTVGDLITPLLSESPLMGQKIANIAVAVAGILNNKWNKARDHADETAARLAAAIQNQGFGDRPITLVGFSLGGRIVVKTLALLAERGVFQRVHEAIALGSAIGVDERTWELARKGTSRRLVNGYCQSDVVLRFLYGVRHGAAAGLRPIPQNGIQNIDLGELTNGHHAYRSHLEAILERVGIDS